MEAAEERTGSLTLWWHRPFMVQLPAAMSSIMSIACATIIVLETFAIFQL
jgi:hypothetical protein